MMWRAIIQTLGLVGGVALLGCGVWFLADPAAALAGTHHRVETLPYVMGGRYVFFGFLLIGALLGRDDTALAFVLAGFAGLGVFDAVLYLDTAPLPHLAAGCLAGAAGLYVYNNRKVAT